MKNKLETSLYYIARTLVGLTFTFSGFVKAIDPWGTAYKIGDYLSAWGTFFFNVPEFTFILSILLCAFELTLGVSLLFGFRARVANCGAALMMLFMTPLTLWIALKNPVQDCGCFGDALIIDNWTTFWKNIVLCTLIAIIFVFRRKQIGHGSTWAQWIAVFFTAIFSIGLSLYSFQKLPMIDFRPYHIGANIIKGMEIPDDAPVDEYNITLIYDSAGVQREFSLDNFPKDSAWTFVDQKSTLVKQGYVPPIHDFSLEVDGEDITDQVLSDPNYTFLIISWDIQHGFFNKENISKLNALYNYARRNNYNLYFMTASVEQDIETLKQKLDKSMPVAQTDKITLKTIVRSNPGVVLIKDGTVINKWSMNTLPKFSGNLNDNKLGLQPQSHATRNVLFTFLIWLSFIIILFVIDKQLHIKRD